MGMDKKDKIRTRLNSVISKASSSKRTFQRTNDVSRLKFDLQMLLEELDALMSEANRYVEVDTTNLIIPSTEK